MSDLPTDIGARHVSFFFPSDDATQLRWWWWIYYFVLFFSAGPLVSMFCWAITRESTLLTSFSNSLSDTFCNGAYLVHYLFKFVSRQLELLLYRPASQITTIFLFRSLLLGVVEWSSLQKSVSLWSVCCRIGSNDLIFENGVPRICCWLWKYFGLGRNRSPLVCRADTNCSWCV